MRDDDFSLLLLGIKEAGLTKPKVMLPSWCYLLTHKGKSMSLHESGFWNAGIEDRKDPPRKDNYHGNS